MSDIDLIYPGTVKKQSPPPKEAIKEEILTNKQTSKKASKQESLQESQEEKKELSFEERILISLQATDLKANTFRYSQEELDFIEQISHEAKMKYRVKLDKNDIARIGLLWLKEDYKKNGEESLIGKILTSKKASK